MALGFLLALVCLQLTWAFSFASSEIPGHRYTTQSDKQILDFLLDPTRYDKRIRPRESTHINMSVLILTLSSPDESSLKYEVEFLLHQRWDDQRLKYDDGGKHEYLNALMHTEKMWIPDTYFIKHGEFKTPLVPVHVVLRLHKNGTVQYTMRRRMSLTCEGNLKIFPFDNPKCAFAVESVSLEMQYLLLQWSKTDPPIHKAGNCKTHNAYLVRNATGICGDTHTWRGSYSCLSVLLLFTRDKLFYFSTVFIPGIVLVTSSFMSFWLDINAVPARVMMGVTTMLNFCTTTNTFRSTLPVVANLTAMNLWDGVCIFFIYASMLEFILVNYLYRQYPSNASRPSSANFSSTDSGGGGGGHARSPVVGPVESSTRKAGNGSQEPSGDNEASSPLTHDLANFERGSQMNHRVQADSKMHATSSFFTWLRHPPCVPLERPARIRLAKTIDNISRIVFPLLFGFFVFGFFITYAVVKPIEADEEVMKEFEPSPNEQ